MKPVNGMEIAEDVVFDPGDYHLPDGISIVADGVKVSGPGASIVGDGRGRGLVVENRAGVQIEDLAFSAFDQAIWVKDARDILIRGCKVEPRWEEEDKDAFLNIWRGPESPYGAGIMFWGVSQSRVWGNILNGQTTGVAMFDCSELQVFDNQANNCSGWGYRLYRVVDSLILRNQADYCNREYLHGERRLQGGDAAGFLLVKGSSRNFLADNKARFGGDGVFVAGMNPQRVIEECVDNTFMNFDVSGATHNGFELTFCPRNHFSYNTASECNYGLWLGYSHGNTIEHNRVENNRWAGLAAENAYDFVVSGNEFVGNRIGVFAWSNPCWFLIEVAPEYATSHDWQIAENRFVENQIGVLVAANIDQWQKPQEAQDFCPPPYSHQLVENEYLDSGQEDVVFNGAS